MHLREFIAGMFRDLADMIAPGSRWDIEPAMQRPAVTLTAKAQKMIVDGQTPSKRPESTIMPPPLKGSVADRRRKKI